MTNRTQLSLFVPPDVGKAIEAVRRVVDPEQSRLIPAHVTLCREDELAAHRMEDIAARLAASRPFALTLRFGAPERFHDHGILLPCIGGADAFDALRARLLAPHQARPHAPHLTLAHPRNPRVPQNELSSAVSLEAGLTITFTGVQLIEQENGAPWQVLREL